MMPNIRRKEFMVEARARLKHLGLEDVCWDEVHPRFVEEITEILQTDGILAEAWYLLCCKDEFLGSQYQRSYITQPILAYQLAKILLSDVLPEGEIRARLMEGAVMADLNAKKDRYDDRLYFYRGWRKNNKNGNLIVVVMNRWKMEEATVVEVCAGNRICLDGRNEGCVIFTDRIDNILRQYCPDIERINRYIVYTGPQAFIRSGKQGQEKEALLVGLDGVQLHQNRTPQEAQEAALSASH